ncbi:transcriptional regulator [Streptomyces olivaceoviridis]|uniref:winged helix-turn-helix transcriptional regulator n=1 Tax=Streptomyces olivaceoviridis TaxID=1921 RepID=UPI00167696A4|nr:helix-turn-helix domain-containing protein [Streptomyces olivaceoviridis]GGY90909.1 transcriptional regulator [Streptomyces olivaceoviridis]
MSVSKNAVDAEAMCPHRLVLEHVTSRWGVLVLIELLERPYRFSELRRAISGLGGRGVSEKMLTQTLQTLERDGLVHRDAKPVIPPRVDYSLTALGREAAEQVRALAQWTHARMDAVAEARRSYDESRRAYDESRQAYDASRGAYEEARGNQSRAS